MPPERALVIYPVGNSDLIKEVDAPTFREQVAWLVNACEARPPLRLTAAADGLLPDGFVVEGASAAGAAPARHEVRFPILRDVVMALLKRPGAAHLRFWFIVTAQTPPHRQDTQGVERLAARYLELLRQFGHLPGDVEVLPGSLVTAKPFSYDDMIAAFVEIEAAIAGEITGADERLYVANPGTPAMAFAAAMTFGRDARVAFVYKPRDSIELDPINGFLALPRQRAIELMQTSLSQGDFLVAAQLLADRMSGFNQREDAVSDTLTRLRVLADWWRELHADAVGHVRDIGPRQRMRFTGTSLIWQLAKRLEHVPSQPMEQAPFWRAKLVDIIIRLRIALIRGDIPGFIDRLVHFLDVSLLYGLYQTDPQIAWRAHAVTLPDNRFAEMRDTYPWGAKQIVNEAQRMHYLLHRARSDPNAAGGRLTDWLDRLLLLRFFVREHLAQYRNDHVHNHVELERSELDAFVRDVAGIRVGLGEGGWVALPLVRQVLDAMPNREFDPDAFVTEYRDIPASLAARYQLTSPVPAPEMAGSPISTETTEDFMREAGARYERARGDAANDVATLLREAQEALRAATAEEPLASTPVAESDKVLHEVDAYPGDRLDPWIEVRAQNLLRRNEAHPWLMRRLLTHADPHFATDIPHHRYDLNRWLKAASESLARQ